MPLTQLNHGERAKIQYLSDAQEILGMLNPQDLTIILELSADFTQQLETIKENILSEKDLAKKIKLFDEFDQQYDKYAFARQAAIHIKKILDIKYYKALEIDTKIAHLYGVTNALLALNVEAFANRIRQNRDFIKNRKHVIQTAARLVDAIGLFRKNEFYENFNKPEIIEEKVANFCQDIETLKNSIFNFDLLFDVNYISELLNVTIEKLQQLPNNISQLSDNCLKNFITPACDTLWNVKWLIEKTDGQINGRFPTLLKEPALTSVEQSAFKKANIEIADVIIQILSKLDPRSYSAFKSTSKEVRNAVKKIENLKMKERFFGKRGELYSDWLKIQETLRQIDKNIQDHGNKKIAATKSGMIEYFDERYQSDIKFVRQEHADLVEALERIWHESLANLPNNHPYRICEKLLENCNQSLNANHGKYIIDSKEYPQWLLRMFHGNTENIPCTLASLGLAIMVVGFLSLVLLYIDRTAGIVTFMSLALLGIALMMHSCCVHCSEKYVERKNLPLTDLSDDEQLLFQTLFNLYPGLSSQISTLQQLQEWLEAQLITTGNVGGMYDKSLRALQELRNHDNSYTEDFHIIKAKNWEEYCSDKITVEEAAHDVIKTHKQFKFDRLKYHPLFQSANNSENDASDLEIVVVGEDQPLMSRVKQNY